MLSKNIIYQSKGVTKTQEDVIDKIRREAKGISRLRVGHLT